MTKEKTITCKECGKRMKRYDGVVIRDVKADWYICKCMRYEPAY